MTKEELDRIRDYKETIKNERCDILKQALADGSHVNCKYKADPWVDHHGAVESYDDNDGRPFVVFCGSERRVYIRDITSLALM